MVQTFLELSNGIPSHDTFGRVFKLLDPEQFEEMFQKWIQGVQKMSKGEIGTMDGKNLSRLHAGFLEKEASGWWMPGPVKTN